MILSFRIAPILNLLEFTVLDRLKGAANLVKTLRKATALGFIASILLGNYWLVYAVLGKETPSWFSIGAFGVVGYLLICMIGQLLYNLLLRSKGGEGAGEED